MTQSAKSGLLLTGVADNIAANACLSLISVGCVAFGVMENANYDDPENWWLPAVVAGFAIFVPAATNTARLAVAGRQRMRAVFRPSGEKISVLIARLVGDRNDTIFRTVREGLERDLGVAIEIGLWPTSLEAGEHGDVRTEEAAACQAGQDLLTSRGYDVLIWGRVKSDEVVALSIGSRQGLGTGSTSYRLTADTLELPIEAVDHLGSLIAVFVLNVCEQQLAFQRGDHYQTVALRRRIEHLARAPKSAFSPETRASIQYSLGLLLLSEAVRFEDDTQLEAAVAAFREAIAQISGLDGNGFREAQIAGKLCEALAVLGDGDARFAEEADQIASNALRRLDGNSHPWLSGNLHFAKGLAISAKFLQGSDAETLQRALSALNAAKDFWTRESTAPAWGVIENNRSCLLRFAYERLGDADALRTAERAARNAIEVLPRDSYPIDWAISQYNLGTILLRLGELSRDSSPLRASIRAFEASLTERPKEIVPVEWSKTMVARGNALSSLGYLLKDQASLEEARRSIRKALIVLPSGQLRETLNAYVSLIATLLGAGERNTVHSGDLVEALEVCSQASTICNQLSDRRTAIKIKGFGYYADALMAGRRGDLPALERHGMKLEAGVELCVELNDHSTADFYRRAADSVRTWRDELGRVDEVSRVEV